MQNIKTLGQPLLEKSNGRRKRERKIEREKEREKERKKERKKEREIELKRLRRCRVGGALDHILLYR